ncbi:MAG TPA: hypothetical protein PK079_22190 [Leptospiraceae bacterium]|nr:hypothetical protein [Leptospiraceae bacterium]HMW08326.1 hypothetical protein [Leptospiraceae bacterium]HMX35474.1 hypothetical protein [Leptospiraceae bacterium]HMY34433.1 hypothetical protein [Leptospiraceae bacterium]HMZ66889.1 hypothetical protein [Leptospiraceae bacterium]
MKNSLYIILILSFFSFLQCGKTIIKVNNPTRVIDPVEEPDYKKRYITNFDGFQEYSRPVTPNKPQSFRSTWFTTKAELEKHKTPVCEKDVDAIILYHDFVDSIIHFWVGGITSSRSILVYCTK